MNGADSHIALLVVMGIFASLRMPPSDPARL